MFSKNVVGDLFAFFQIVLFISSWRTKCGLFGNCQGLTPLNPCPNYFQYRYDDLQGGWYGYMEIPPPQQGSIIVLNVGMSILTRLPTSDVGAIELFDSRQAALLRFINRQTIRYKVRFPVQFPLPKLTSIQYNSNQICYGPADRGPVVTNIRLEHTLYRREEPNKGSMENLSPFINNGPNLFNNNQEGAYEKTTDDLDHVYNPENYPPPDIIYSAQQHGQQPISTQRPNIPTTYFTTYTRPTTKTTSVPLQFETTSKQPAQTSFDNYGPTQLDSETKEICGKPDINYITAPLIVKGETTRRGLFPWIVGLFSNTRGTLSFFCAGNLISQNLVVTAAHCLDSKTVTLSILRVFLGRYDYQDPDEEGGRSVYARELIVHQDYMKKRNSFDADIALIVLEQRITYSKYIRPICLWNESNEVSEIVGRMGVVLGWGYNELGHVSTNKPTQTLVPIVSAQECLLSHEAFQSFTSNRTFCGGRRDGTGPCNGDSGGGLFIEQNNRWALRGVVSVAISNAVSGFCDLNHYVVYSDVSKFYNWIAQYL